MQSKSIKSAAKEAKMRLKNRFWEDYKKEVCYSILLGVIEYFN